MDGTGVIPISHLHLVTVAVIKLALLAMVLAIPGSRSGLTIHVRVLTHLIGLKFLPVLTSIHQVILFIKGWALTRESIVCRMG